MFFVKDEVCHGAATHKCWEGAHLTSCEEHTPHIDRPSPKLYGQLDADSNGLGTQFSLGSTFVPTDNDLNHVLLK